MKNIINGLFLLLLLTVSIYSQVQNHNALVILVNFQDDVRQPYPISQAQNILVTTNSYYSEVSYGRVAFSGDVYGWFTIPVTYTTCDKASIATYAQQAATNAGANLANYQHLIYMFPRTMACGFAGNSTIGGNPTQEWINSDNAAFPVVGHELGHGFGLYHSNSLDCGALAYGTNCTEREYGDVFDIMGGTAPTGHFNIFQKERLNWITVPTVANGTFTLLPVEVNQSGIKILQSYNALGQAVYYYIEFRRYIGFDTEYTYYQSFDGLVIHIGTPAEGSVDLLDMTPETLNDYDSTLPVGRTFSDGNISITTVSVSDSEAVAQVSTINPIPTPSPTPTQQVDFFVYTNSVYKVNKPMDNAFARLTVNSVGYGGIPVTFTLIRPDGTQYSQVDITDGVGYATFTYNFSRKTDPQGTYILRGSATYNGTPVQYNKAFQLVYR